MLQSGFVPEDSKDFASRIYSVIKSNLNLSPDAEADVEEEVEVEENVPSDSSEHDKVLFAESSIQRNLLSSKDVIVTRHTNCTPCRNLIGLLTPS